MWSFNHLEKSFFDPYSDQCIYLAGSEIFFLFFLAADDQNMFLSEQLLKSLLALFCAGEVLSKWCDNPFACLKQYSPGITVTIRIRALVDSIPMIIVSSRWVVMKDHNCVVWIRPFLLGLQRLSVPIVNPFPWFGVDGIAYVVPIVEVHFIKVRQTVNIHHLNYLNLPASYSWPLFLLFSLFTFFSLYTSDGRHKRNSPAKSRTLSGFICCQPSAIHIYSQPIFSYAPDYCFFNTYLFHTFP